VILTNLANCDRYGGNVDCDDFHIDAIDVNDC